MSAYIKLSTLEYPRHQGDIRLEHPNIGEEFVCPETYAHVEYVEMPDHNHETQTAYQLLPVQTDKVWSMVWAVRDLTAEELADKIRWQEEMRNRNSVTQNVDVPGTEPTTIG
jgi:hypothetical protein